MRLRHAVLLATLGAAGCSTPSPYTGEPFTRDHKIYVRRVSPTKDELAAQPAPKYEDLLRRQEAERERLEVSREMHEHTLYLDRGAATMRQHIGPGPERYDPWDGYEADRQRVLVRDWADTGKHAPIEPVVKKERVVQDDPFAEIKKITKKKAEGEGEAPAADGEKKGEGEGDKKDEKKE